MITMTPRDVIARAHAFVRAYDLQFADCFAVDGVLELPFAPRGMPRRIEGRAVPFEAAAERIAQYLKETVERTALAQYVARLASGAAIEGVTLADAEALRVH